MILALRSLKIVVGILLIIFLLLGSINFFYFRPAGNENFERSVVDFSTRGTALLLYSIYVLSTGWIERYRKPVDGKILLIGIIAGAAFAYSALTTNLLMCGVFITVVLSDAILLYSRRPH